ncbi:MAG: dihydrolipoyl dehydrogenase [Gammaproteobacteria bacterium]|nr:dihydrolipoyl dehydrogenase [Gammaproteobacteria bacterium]
MAKTVEVKVPDIGDFKDVDVVDVAIKPGDAVNEDDPLITLESDKASMDVPAPRAGTVKAVKVSAGDKVSEGSVIAVFEVQEPAEAEASAPAREEAPAPQREPERRPAPAATGKADVEAEVVVLGSGPGGYTAAFRAADLGKRTVLVERYSALGGVCLNVGCIPSKALLHTAEVLVDVRAMAEHGVEFGDPKIDLIKLGAWKDSVVGRLTKGLDGLAKQRKVQVIQGRGSFTSPNEIRVETDDGAVAVAFEHAIIAAGSQAAQIPDFPNDDPRLMDSTDALLLEEIPERLLVVGGGIIGLEMAAVYHGLGSRITVVELTEGLMPGCDRDLVRVLQKRIEKQYENIYVGTKVSRIESRNDGLAVRFEGKGAPDSDLFDRILVAVGRRPNGDRIGAENAGVHVDDRAFIPVDRQQRTNVSHIFAIGDIVGQPMLAHKATHEGKVAAEVAAGQKTGFDALTIPSVAYTDPEVAWMGLTETEARSTGREYDKAVFPWAASGRSLGMGRDEGMTKLLFDKENRRLLGAGIVGPHAGDLIAETVVALELGADAEDIGLSVHPHPTLSETICFAAEMAQGTITDLYAPRKK